MSPGGKPAGVVLAGTGTVTNPPPEFSLKALLEFGDGVAEGLTVRAVALPWFLILDMIERDPAATYQIDPRRWEEIIAGAYEREGFDEVILTPRSGDNGRDGRGA